MTTLDLHNLNLRQRNKRIEDFLHRPLCLSAYHKDWDNGKIGCLFFDGKNLSIINAAHRMMDPVMIFPMHYGELQAAKIKDNILIYHNDALLLFVYFLDIANRGDSAYIIDEDILIEYFQSYFWADTLSDYKDILTLIRSFTVVEILAPKFNSAIRESSRFLEKLFNSKKDIMHNITFPTEICISIANHEDNVVLKSNPPVVTTNSEFETNSEVAPILSLIDEKLFIYTLCSFDEWSIDERGKVDGNSNIELVGMCAAVFSAAVHKNDIRNDLLLAPRDKNNEMAIPEVDFSSIEYLDFCIKWMNRFSNYSKESSPFNTLTTTEFNLYIDQKTLFQTYLQIILPHWKYSLKHTPGATDVLLEEKTLYSFLIMIEKKLLQYSEESDTWKSLLPSQQKTIKGYAQGLFMYLKHYHHADESFAKHIIDEYNIDIYSLFQSVYGDILRDNDYANMTISREVALERLSKNCKTVETLADWTLIDLWLIDKKEVPAHYQEDYDNFHSIMNRYLRNKTQLEDILAYLRRYDGKFLNLPRHSKGKSKGRLDQTAIREAMDAAGFSFKKSNYSKVLSGH